MHQFVYGTDEQYDNLREQLNDRMCHVFSHCMLPPSFSREVCRIGFEKEETTFALFIDKGITCRDAAAKPLLKDWLAKGTLRFLDYSDIKTFLRSLTYLYD